MTSDIFTCHLPRSCTIDRHTWNVLYSAPWPTVGTIRQNEKELGINQPTIVKFTPELHIPCSPLQVQSAAAACLPRWYGGQQWDYSCPPTQQWGIADGSSSLCFWWLQKCDYLPEKDHESSSSLIVWNVWLTCSREHIRSSAREGKGE